MITELSPSDLASLLHGRQVTLVDVREPAEFAAEHIAGATSHPLSAFNPAHLPAGALVFSCGTGKRSQAALAACHAAGLPHQTHLKGGLKAWKDAGFPTTDGIR